MPHLDITANPTRTAPAVVHELFERQAASTPDELAAVCRDVRLTYRQLDEAANRVARYLREDGAARGELIGVAMGRSAAMVAALFGVWKAGCAYVPLDPAYPAERLRFMASDAGLFRILADERSQAAMREAIDGVAPSRLLDLGPRAAAWRLPCHPLPRGGAPDSLAYVMYTSGSTGRPKGAMITHGGLANYLCWAASAYGVQRGGSVPVHSSLSFDLTVTSLFVPLLVGAHVELLDEENAAQALLHALRTRKRSLVKITPAHLDLLSHEALPEEMAEMTSVFVIGGENLTAERLAPWRKHAPATRLINEYGPTETVVGCCIHEVGASDPQNGSVPIGRAIANMRMHVLDEAGHPVGMGVAGELYIGGPGVALGYLNRPELTTERFVPDPLAASPGARLYRTGDLGRMREDGILEYLGRRDEQVKVRGYRIELGEIEETLAAHAEVRAAAAVVHKDGAGENAVAAFVVLHALATVGVDDLMRFLGDRLPGYMLPGSIEVLEALPLNINGKVDRQALHSRLSGAASASSESPEDLAQTPAERMVAQAFREAFQRRDIGNDDNFFDLGGHSLMAVRLMAALRTSSGANLPLRLLYERPTIRGLAEALEAMLWSKAAPSGDGPRGDDDGGRMRMTF